MNRRWPFGLGPVLAMACLAGGCTKGCIPFLAPSLPTTHLDVRVHASAPMTLGEATEIAKQATNILQQQDSATEDVSCMTTIQVDDLGPFQLDGFTGAINNECDFNAVFGGTCSNTGVVTQFAPTSTTISAVRKVRVVSEINWCGPEVVNAAGCADIGGTRIAVTRPWSAVKEHVLWAHEVGHTHGNHDTEVLLQVMYKTIRTPNLRVTDPQCGLYKW